MSAGETHGRSRQLRDKARELNEAAARSADPEESRRLREKAHRLQEQSEKERVIDDPGMDLR
ncbi:hypothetical protein J7F03_17660 [Streptomyces sp. ISL-43]|uniref:DUF6381 family protein n=1 Tax=Streptomyces sp. ISL-43 TaxID=2819183 RepID=UPI001BEAF751|nr:DUF6381 family protein [Streptomyces sp. ISL-43]MBT2448885.1 hypothetical protein [Streptomyces sp. ISL-43]